MRRTGATLGGWLAGGAVATLLLAATLGGIVLGQVDDFEDGSLQNWARGPGSSEDPVNVADGGPQGAGDNYLEKTGTGEPVGGALELRNNQQWSGDYLAAGVTRITGRMAGFGSGDGDPSDDPDLHVRLVVEGGTPTSRYWSVDPAILPPDGEWRWVVFDLDDLVPAEDLMAGSTLDDVLADVRLLWIVSEDDGDGDELDWPPDPVAGTLGLDDLSAAGFSVTEKGTQPGLTHFLHPVGDCQFCHGSYDPIYDVEPWNTWAGSMMAQATRDPLFWAALDVANNDFPGAGDFCLRCHTPAGWLNRRSEPLADGCGLEGAIDQTGEDFDGLTCHFCHRMMVNEVPPPGEEPVYFENAQYWIDDVDCDLGEPCRRGPYDYSGGQQPPPHAWAYSQYHVDADICGNCHNVTNPVKTLIDENGVDTGIPFPVERTFDEWDASDYADGEPCQSCHMPDAVPDMPEQELWACATLENDRSGDLPVHEFVGGNAWIPEVLRVEYPNLGLEVELAAARDRALAMLQEESATVGVEAGVADDTLGIEVTVTNLTGHKLPTGYPEGRRMWLHVEARDGLDNVIWESGAYDELTGVLTRDEQIKVYETKHGIWDYNGTGECDTVDGFDREIFHFILNDCIALDNRIPPLGFTGGEDPEIQPVNYVYPETSPGSGVLVNFDVTAYTVALPPEVVEPVTVTATLRYQTASKEYVDFLLAESDENAFPNDCIDRSGSPGPQSQTRAEILYDMWVQHDRSPPVDMDSAAAAAMLCYPLTLGHSGEGADPVAAPGSSGGCPAGTYVAGETIDLTAAPAEGWVVAGWSGTDDDTSTELTNTVTMPAAAHAAAVAYAIPLDLDLTMETVDTERLFLACNTIGAGDGFVIGTGGDATLRAGSAVTFRDGFSVLTGGGLAVELDPAICAAAPAR